MSKLNDFENVAHEYNHAKFGMEINSEFSVKTDTLGFAFYSVFEKKAKTAKADLKALIFGGTIHPHYEIKEV